MLIAAGEVELEGRWDGPAGADRAVVFCHPHPQHGGTMRGPLMHKVTAAMTAQGLRVLRFNFRGVGASTGTWSGGEGEIDDVGAAMAEAAQQYGADVALAGWSFGAVTALHWQARSGSGARFAGIAPPVVTEQTAALPTAAELVPARRLFVVGDRDQFVTADDLGDYATSIGADLELLEGSDHFFYSREDRVGDVLADFFATDGA